MLLPSGRWNNHLNYNAGRCYCHVARKKTCNNHRVQVYFKGGTTIKNLLMAPKDQDPIKSRSGVIYRFKCNRVECDDEYIGQSSRTFGERFKEHLKAPSSIF